MSSIIDISLIIASVIFNESQKSKVLEIKAYIWKVFPK